MTIDRAGVARLVPHAGAMCLLDAVVTWDRDHIVCHTERHRAADNPLRAGDRLSAIHAIEFAAQAMAVHQRLAGERTDLPRYGLLVSVRQCAFFTDRLDTCALPLVIEATRVAATTEAFTYLFTVGQEGAALVTGRASILLVMGGEDA